MFKIFNLSAYHNAVSTQRWIIAKNYKVFTHQNTSSYAEELWKLSKSPTHPNTMPTHRGTLKNFKVFHKPPYRAHKQITKRTHSSHPLPPSCPASPRKEMPPNSKCTNLWVSLVMARPPRTFNIFIVRSHHNLTYIDHTSHMMYARQPSTCLLQALLPLMFHHLRFPAPPDPHLHISQ